jgi:hypothetical protein
MYAGLRAGATAEEVIAEAERANAPFCKFDEYKTWLKDALGELRK